MSVDPSTPVEGSTNVPPFAVLDPRCAGVKRWLELFGSLSVRLLSGRRMNRRRRQEPRRYQVVMVDPAQFDEPRLARIVAMMADRWNLEAADAAEVIARHGIEIEVMDAVRIGPDPLDVLVTFGPLAVKAAAAIEAGAGKGVAS